MAEPIIREIASAHAKTPAQVVLRWHVQQPGVVAIPRSSNRARIAENLDCFDFTLSDDEMQRISSLARASGRMINPAFAPTWDEVA